MMRTLAQILRKEFLQLVRTPALVFILFLCPVVVVGIVPFGLSNKTRLRVEVVDETFSGRGRETVSALAASPQIARVSLSSSLQESERRIDSGNCSRRNPVIFTTSGNTHHNFFRIKFGKVSTGNKTFRAVGTPHAAMEPYDDRRICALRRRFPGTLANGLWPPDSRRTLEARLGTVHIYHKRIWRRKSKCARKEHYPSHQIAIHHCKISAGFCSLT